MKCNLNASAVLDSPRPDSFFLLSPDELGGVLDLDYRILAKKRKSIEKCIDLRCFVVIPEICV